MLLTKLINPAHTSLKSKNKQIIIYRASKITNLKFWPTRSKLQSKTPPSPRPGRSSNKLSALISKQNSNLSIEQKSTKNYFQNFSDNFNKVSSFLVNAKNLAGATTFEQSERLRNLEWSRYTENIVNGINGAAMTASNNSGNARKESQANDDMNDLQLETEKLEKINDERFYQRVALSKHTQKLLTQMKMTIQLVKKLPSPSIIGELTANCPSPELDANLLKLIAQVEQLAKLMTNQPESVLMAIRFDAEKLIKEAGKEFNRLVVESDEMSNILSTTVNNPSVSSKRAIKICQVLTGEIDPPKGRHGVRILCLDGGGTRGILTLEILRQLQKTSGGRPIHTLFDYICGVSTGAILAFMIGVQKRPLDEIEEIYRELSSQIFSTNIWKGSLGLIQQQSYHPTDLYEGLLQDLFLDCMLLEAAIDSDCPRIAAISCLSNRPQPKPFLWRNYNLIYGKNMEQQIHLGTINAPVWKAVRASSAAPGYFREFQTQMNDKVRISPTSVDIHSDGGVLCNNPSFVAKTECQALWPDYELQTLVSIGTGRFEPTIGPSGKGITTSLLDKVNLIVNSATGVDQVHKTMYSTLPEQTYFRFNPYGTGFILR